MTLRDLFLIPPKVRPLGDPAKIAAWRSIGSRRDVKVEYAEKELTVPEYACNYARPPYYRLEVPRKIGDPDRFITFPGDGDCDPHVFSWTPGLVLLETHACLSCRGTSLVSLAQLRTRYDNYTMIKKAL